MDVSAEAADLVVKESIQATEAAAKLAGSGLKNVAALILALLREDYKLTGETSAKRLAKDAVPATVIPIKRTDMPKFQKLAKEYGVLYFIAQKKNNETGIVDVVSNQNYAAQLNAVFQAMGYPIPNREEQPVKKAEARAPQERSSPERGNGLTQEKTAEKPSVRGRLAALQEASQGLRSGPDKQKELTR